MTISQCSNRADVLLISGAWSLIPAINATAEKTSAKLETLALKVDKQARGKVEPAVEVPVRALSNVSFNPTHRIVEMGDRTQRRSFFNYGQTKRFMQTLLLASKCKDLVDADMTASIRQIYYMSKHTIKGTGEKTFDDQGDSDPVLEDLLALPELRRHRIDGSPPSQH